MLTKTEARKIAATLKDRLKAKAAWKAARRAIVNKAVANARNTGKDGAACPKGKFRSTVREQVVAAIVDIADTDPATFGPGFNYSPEKKAAENGSLGFYMGKDGPVIAGSWRNDLNAALSNCEALYEDDMDAAIDAWLDMAEPDQYRPATVATKPPKTMTKPQKAALSALNKAVRQMTAAELKAALEAFFAKAPAKVKEAA